MGTKMKHRKARTGMNVLTSCISTTLVLVLLGTVVFFVTLAHNFSNSLKENFNVSLLLDDDVTQKQAYDLQTRLKQMPCTRLVNYVSKERALKEQAKALGTDPTEFMKENPMPAAFEVYLKAEYATNDSLKHIIPQLKADKAVMEVAYPENLIESLNTNIRRISLVMLIVALLLTIVSFALINNTIRLGVHAQRFRIYTMTLVGASWGFIRRPFIAKAFWIGFVSAVLATGVLAGGIYAMTMYEPQMHELLNWQGLGGTFGVVFLCGILLTLLCAYFSVNKNLKMSYNKLHRY